MALDAADDERWVAAMANDLGRGVKAARARARMSQSDLADAIGLSQGAVMNIEAGSKRTKTLPRIDVLFRIAAALDAPPASLLFPGVPGEIVEVLPGREVPAAWASEWLTGGAPLPGGNTSFYAEASRALRLARREAELLHAARKDAREQQNGLDMALRARERAEVGSPEHQQAERLVAHYTALAAAVYEPIREIRTEQRKLGLVPVPLPTDLEYLDTEPAEGDERATWHVDAGENMRFYPKGVGISQWDNVPDDLTDDDTEAE